MSESERIRYYLWAWDEQRIEAPKRNRAIFRRRAQLRREDAGLPGDLERHASCLRRVARLKWLAALLVESGWMEPTARYLWLCRQGFYTDCTRGKRERGS